MMITVFLKLHHVTVCFFWNNFWHLLNHFYTSFGFSEVYPVQGFIEELTFETISLLWLIRNYLHTCNHQVHKQTFGWIENNSLDHEDHRAYEFVSLLSSNHRSVLWPVDH